VDYSPKWTTLLSGPLSRAPWHSAFQQPVPAPRSRANYRGTSLIRNSPPLGTYSSICLGPYGGPGGGGGFLCARYPCSPESTSHKNYVPDAHERLESGGRLFGPPLDFSVGSTHVMGPTITSHGRESSAPPPLQDQAPATPRRAEGGAPSRTQAVAKLPAPSRAPSPQRLHSFQCR